MEWREYCILPSYNNFAAWKKNNKILNDLEIKEKKNREHSENQLDRITIRDTRDNKFSLLL